MSVGFVSTTALMNMLFVLKKNIHKGTPRILKKGSMNCVQSPEGDAGTLPD